MDRRRNHRGWEGAQPSNQRIRRRSQRDEGGTEDAHRRRNRERNRHKGVGNRRRAGRGERRRKAEVDRKAENRSWVEKNRHMMGQKILRMTAVKGSRCCPHKLGGRHGGIRMTQGRVRDGQNRRRRTHIQRKRGDCRSNDLMAGMQDVGRRRRSKRLPRRGREPRGEKRRRSNRTCGWSRKRIYRQLGRR